MYHNQSNGSKCVIDVCRTWPTFEKTDLGHVRQQSVTWEKDLIEHVINVKTLNGSEHDGRSFKRWYGFYAFTNQFLTTVCSTFNPTCDAQMRTGIHLWNVVSLKYDHFFFIAKLIIFVAYVNSALFFFYRPTAHVH